MKKFLVSFILISSVIAILFTGLAISPYYFYKKILDNKFEHRLYKLDYFNRDLLKPSLKVSYSNESVDARNLWKMFHLVDVLIPLPVRHPLYSVSPQINYVNPKRPNEVGVKFYGTDQRELARIYLLQNIFFVNQLDSQELFKLPIVRNQLLNLKSEQIWKDVFSLDLTEWNIPFAKMIYHLYILQIRTSLLPQSYLGYGLLESEKIAIIKLKSKNQDYNSELVMTKDRGIIYSYLLITEKENIESEKLRGMFLREIRFRSSNHYLAGMLYKEFKNLPFERQSSHEGMLYLYSAWTHGENKESYLKEMINYLERGEKNQLQLRPLYEYAKKRYGKTFSESFIKGIYDKDEDDKTLLQRQIEVEKILKQRNERQKDFELPETAPVELTDEQKLQHKLKKAKSRKNKNRSNQQIIIN